VSTEERVVGCAEEALDRNDAGAASDRDVPAAGGERIVADSGEVADGVRAELLDLRPRPIRRACARSRYDGARIAPTRHDLG